MSWMEFFMSDSTFGWKFSKPRIVIYEVSLLSIKLSNVFKLVRRA